MIREITTDKEFLKLPAIDGACKPREVRDLLDTANAYFDKAAGLAANQIKSRGCFFVVKIEGVFVEFLNPKIIARTGGIKAAHETCLSRPGERPVKKRRYKVIKIKFKSLSGFVHKKTYKGFVARVIQHKMDHLKGRLI